MRNPLDLNNLPEDFVRDHDKQPLDDSSSVAGSYMKKKSGGKDESGKVYECRFCSLKFCKSQALGGHMNRHRQERETETLHRARQLVFGNDNLYQLGRQPVVHGGYHRQQQQAGCNISSTVYPTRLFSGTTTTMQPPPPSRLNMAYKTHSGTKDYLMGHVCSGNSHFILHTTAAPPDQTSDNNYTCVGAPVGQPFTVVGGSSSRDIPINSCTHQDGFL